MEGFSMNYSNNSSNSNAGSKSNCNGTKYVIQKGDTLYSISRRYNVPLALVLRANPYVDVYNLQVGDAICIPSEKESSAPSRPPVVTGPGPVIMPEDSGRITDDLLEAEPPVPVVTGPAPTPVAPSMPSAPATYEETTGAGSQSSVMTAPVTIPARNDSQQPSYVAAPSSTTSPSQNVRTEMGSRNTFNFNYYGGSESSRSSASRENEETVRPKAPTMTPARGKSSARQTIPVRRPVSSAGSNVQSRPQTTTVRQTMPAQPQTTTARQPMPAQPQRAAVRQTMPVKQQKAAPQPMPVRTNIQPKQAIPVRIIAQPVEEIRDDKESCNRWNAYQDRERFNSIMYDNDNMMKSACENSCPSRCTENVFSPDADYKPCKESCQIPCKSWDDKDDDVTLISYISRDNDTLQDIMDYFTMDLSELFIYTIPNEIKLKPGCMIRVRGKGDDR